MLLLTLLHFLVDGLCACALMMLSHQIVSDVEAYAMIVLYDVLAFGTQPLTGRWVDGGDSRSRALKLSMALLVGGALTCSLRVTETTVLSLCGAVLLGMGNSLFHVYGGRYVALASHHDVREMGVFVSTGAVGLATGIGFSSPKLLAGFALAFVALSALHLRHAMPLPVSSVGIAPKPATLRTFNASVVIYLCCLMLVVTGRAFIGESVPSLHQSILSVGTPLLMVMVSIVVMAGKMAGGYLSKWWGVSRVFYASMLLSGTAFLMCPWHDGFVLCTLFLINLSMPCTLYLATKAMPGREGLAFGLLAMAILPGFLLGTLSKHDATCQYLLVPLMGTIVLESLLLLCLRERRWQVLAASVALNILTNVPLNAFAIAFKVTSPLFLITLECMVVVVEFIGFWAVLHERGRAFRYSLLCNAFSALTGHACQLLFVDYLGWY